MNHCGQYNWDMVYFNIIRYNYDQGTIASTNKKLRIRITLSLLANGVS